MSGQVRRRVGASRYQACERKAGRWDTEKKAQEACDRFMKERPWSLPKMVYKCPWGDHYHYGSPLDRRTDRRK
jgi:hypothetical protein